MANYTITGSLGHISRPLVAALTRAGHRVTVITSNPANAEKIEALGAHPAVGKLQDEAFVTEAFRGADAVYTMIPPDWQATDWRAAQNEVGRIYVRAIKQAGVTRVVNLSSVGAHLGNGCGPVDGLADFEKMLDALPGIHVRHLRPSFFYYNLFAQVGLLKNAGIMGANYGGGQEKLVLVHTNDIAAVAVEHLLALDFAGRSVQYISSDERTGVDIARVLSQAVGREAPWVEFPDEQAKSGMLQAGLSEIFANEYVQLGQALRSGKSQEDYWKHTPTKGPTKLEDFAREFAQAYQAG